MRTRGQWSWCFCLVGSISFGLATSAFALDRTWIGGGANWLDGGFDANWNPNDEPDSDDRAIFNTANTVNLGSNNAVNGLVLSGGIDLSTNNFDLLVDGLVELAGSGTNLFINTAVGEVNADDVTINSLGTLELQGGVLILDEEAGTSLLDINVGGNLEGNGTITFADTPIAVTTFLVNDGTLTARSRPANILNPPPAGGLVISDSSTGGRVDLDGAGELGVVNVNRNQTLDLNVPLSDNFNGTMNLFHNTEFDSLSPWALATNGTINVDNGAVDGLPAIPKGTSIIAGESFTQLDGTINVVDADGTLQFDVPYLMQDGVFNNNGHVIFNADATIVGDASFNMLGSGPDLTVGAGAEVSITQNNFNLDGGVVGQSAITVNEGGTLTMALGDYDSDVAVNTFDGVINLDNGTFIVNVADPRFVMNGTVNLNDTQSEVTLWGGTGVAIGNDSGANDAHLNVLTGATEFGTSVEFKSDADVQIDDGAFLIFRTTVNFDTVNGANEAEFTGGGAILFNALVNINEAVTFDMSGGTVDFDGNDTFGSSFNINAPVVVNAETMSSFGHNSTGGVSELNINNNAGTGSLTVDLDDNSARWTLNEEGVMNLVNDNTAAVLLSGNAVNINGTMNVTGDVQVSAPLHIGPNATIHINTAGEQLRFMSGGNTISGGTITGAGRLATGSGFQLEGFGTIDNDILFEGQSSLRAKGGTLTLNGEILAAVGFGTADATGILNVVDPWDSGVIGGVSNRGGIIQGGTITNNADGGIGGVGTVTARVINNTRLSAGSLEGDLVHVFETAGNDNDWDGAGAGRLEAFAGNTLELRDVGAAFGFTGTVYAEEGGRVFTNGFALDFNPGSAISLKGSTYESTSSTNIGGTVSIGGGAPSTVRVENNFILRFESSSVTTLGGDLEVRNNNFNIEAGATFSGTGALVVKQGSNLLTGNGANVNVLVVNEGGLYAGGIDSVGSLNVKDLQNIATAETYVELRGKLLNQFDRVAASGIAIIDGFLEIDVDGGFVPELGDLFPIFTGTFVQGQFDYYDIENINEMPDDLAFRINYLSNGVQLEVVNKTFFEADFDEDGDVDPTDYRIWKNAFGLNQLGDANGDNVSNAADYTIWRNQLGSKSGDGAGSLVFGQTAVPEPGAMRLMLLAVPMASIWRKRRPSTLSSALVE